MYGLHDNDLKRLWWLDSEGNSDNTKNSCVDRCSFIGIDIDDYLDPFNFSYYIVGHKLKQKEKKSSPKSPCRENESK